MSDNWVVQNLENALNSWNEKMSEIWQLVTQSPEDFKGGSIWSVIVNIHDAVKAIGLALLVLFFVVGVMKTCGSFAELKKPEHAIKLFVRFAIAKGVVTYGLELMMALFKIVQGLISTIMNASGLGTADQTVLPAEMVTAIEDCGFFESVPLWAVTLIGSLVITVLSFIMIMSVENRHRMSARASSNLTPPCVWKARSLFSPVSSFRCSRPHRRRSTPTPHPSVWSGAISRN